MHVPLLRSHWARRALGLLSFVAAPVGAHTSENTLLAALNDDWRWAHFTPESGLPSAEVHELVETPGGTVWAATGKGLAWFDGFQWFSAAIPHDFATSPPTKLTLDVGEEILAAAGGELYRVGKDGVEPLPLRWNGEAIDVLDLARTPAGLVVWTGQVFVHFEYVDGKLGNGSAISDPMSYRNRGQVLWEGRTGGLIYREGALLSLSRQRAVLRAPAQDGFIQVAYAVEDRHGTGLAFVVYPYEMEGLWEWEAGGTPRQNLEEIAIRPAAVTMGPDGEVVAVYDSDTVRVRENGVWSTASRLPARLRDILFVRFRGNGDLWVGTRKGLFLHHRSSRRWTSWRHDFADPRNRVNEILLRSDGSIWSATAAGLAVYHEDGTEEWIREIGSRELRAVTGLEEDRAGNVWISSGAGFPGTYRWDGSEWRHFGPERGLDAERVHKIRRDREGRLWFLGLSVGYEASARGEGPGAFLYDGEGFVRWGTDEGLPNGRVYAFAESSDGALWFGTLAGLSRWKDGRWDHWGPDEGVYEKVFALEIDDRDRVWFGHQLGFGLGYIDQSGEARYFTRADGLVHDAVWDLSVGADGALWIATHGGLASYRDGVWSRFDAASGLSDPYLWPIKATSDHVFVGTHGGGISRLTLTEKNEPPPRLAIDAPIVGGSDVQLSWHALPFWGKVAASDALTRYRLDDGPWSEWGTERAASYGDVASGGHLLHLQSKSAFGSLGERSSAFVVPGPAWAQPVFLLPLVVLVAGLVGLGGVIVERRRRYARSLAELQEQLYRSQKMEAMGRLAGGVAHDFNNLLTVILGYAELSSHGVAEDDELSENLEQIAKAGRRASDLTGQLLTFARKRVVEPRVVQLNDLIVELDAFLRRVLGEQVELVTLPGDGLWPVMLDPGQFQQVLTNLAVNARDAMPDGGKLVIETMNVSQPEARHPLDGPPRTGDYVLVSVADGGHGMSADVQAHLFEPFFTTKEHGTGLGLSTCYGIVQQAGGNISASSEANAGTRFDIYLPRVEGVVSPIPAPAAGQSAVGGSETILIAEDDPLVREVITVTLQRHGYRVLTTRSSIEAIDVVHGRSEDIQLLVTDVVMPRLGGPELARRVRAILPALKVLYVSGYTADRSLDHVAAEPGASYLPKPFTPALLVEKVRELLDRPDATA